MRVSSSAQLRGSYRDPKAGLNVYHRRLENMIKGDEMAHNLDSVLKAIRRNYQRYINETKHPFIEKTFRNPTFTKTT